MLKKKSEYGNINKKSLRAHKGGLKMTDRNNDTVSKSLRLEQFNPSHFLLSNEVLDQILDSFIEQKRCETELATEKERSISIGISFAVSIFCSIESFFNNIPSSDETGKFLLYMLKILATGIIAFWLITCIVSYIRKRLKMNTMDNDIKAEMKVAAKRKINYTAILIIANKESNGELKLFVDKHGKSNHAYFLPYCSMNRTDSIQYQGERIKRYVGSHYGLSLNEIIEVIDLSAEPTFSIKSTRSGTAEEQHAFAFFRICLTPEAKRKFDNYVDGGWYSVNDLKSNPQAVERNGDVISKLDENPEFIMDSFIGERKPSMKIIWNITNECGYKCDICATHDENRKELSLEDKLKVLQSILTIRDRIGMLDFAGGDPCKSHESLLIIQEAIYALGAERVSITTTGDGINSLDASKRKALLYQCEITVDIEHQGNTKFIKRAAQGYVETNIDQLVTYGDDTQRITINMPIIHTDLNDNEIKNIVLEIEKIKNANRNAKIYVSFLRLMPVGKTNTKNYPEMYLPWETINKIRTYLEPMGISCTSHCSLNVCNKDELGRGCSRLKFKLGIDCAGNVFACAWAGYLPEAISTNPFYIGNLLEMDLQDILSESINQNANFRKMCKYDTQSIDHCPLISYIYNTKDPNKNSDPLSK